MAAVAVEGLFVAKADACFDDQAGHPVWLRGNTKGRLGTTARKGARILAEHGDLFEPLTEIPVDYDTD
jgi:hypothetical protein